MACCFSLFYDASGLSWGEEILATAIINASKAAEQQPRVSTDRPLFEEDYTAAVELDDLLTPSSGGQFRVTDYAPRAFRHLREDPQFKNNIDSDSWLKEWEQTRANPQAGAEGSGRSGATFVPSVNNHYMIKNIDQKEVAVQLRTMRQYVAHFERYPDSLLMRHYALLKIDEVNQSGKAVLTKYLLVFENVIDVGCNLKVPMEKWDLKGRIPKPGKLPHPDRTQGGTRKDKDLLRDFRVSQGNHKAIVEQLQRDSDYLKDHDLMDYSLFLCIIRTNLSLEQRKKLVSSVNEAEGLTSGCLKTYFNAGSMPVREGVHRYHNGVLSHDGTELFLMGVIDTLTNYHSMKKLANCCKQFAFFEEQLSTIPAEAYGNRFFKFVTCIFRHKPRQTASIVGALPNEVGVA